ncbi:MAG: hypothetical protein ACHQT8_00585 [Chlamydiales bacterium]
MTFRAVLYSLFLTMPLFSMEQSQVSFRTTFLQNFDKMLSLLIEPHARTYLLEESHPGEELKNSDPYLLRFDPLYGYFSEERALVGRVTRHPSDFTVAVELLVKIHNKILDPLQCDVMSSETMTKLVAYRDLTPGMVLPFPTVDPKRGPAVILYTVDEVIDLWRGMPAYGLIPQQKGSAPPILLFRGTDFSLVTEKGWASILSDLEIRDPGLSTFHHGQPKIHAWLEKATKNGEKARVMGFSLGGILAAYTLIYETALINQEAPSISFNAPGVSPEIFIDWSQLERPPPFLNFVTEGDMIPKYGLLIGQTYLLFQEICPAPLKAHTQLITLSSTYRLQNIDQIQENRRRQK